MSSQEAIKRARKNFRSSPKGKYYHQRSRAFERNIPWQFTFQQWWDVWSMSGKWEERGPCGYVMCRKGDTGPYSVDNVEIKFHTENRSDSYYNNKRPMPNRWGKKGAEFG